MPSAMPPAMPYGGTVALVSEASAARSSSIGVSRGERLHAALLCSAGSGTTSWGTSFASTAQLLTREEARDVGLDDNKPVLVGGGQVDVEGLAAEADVNRFYLRNAQRGLQDPRETLRAMRRKLTPPLTKGLTASSGSPLQLASAGVLWGRQGSLAADRGIQAARALRQQAEAAMRLANYVGTQLGYAAFAPCLRQARRSQKAAVGAGFGGSGSGPSSELLRGVAAGATGANVAAAGYKAGSTQASKDKIGDLQGAVVAPAVSWNLQEKVSPAGADPVLARIQASSAGLAAVAWTVVAPLARVARRAAPATSSSQEAAARFI